MLNNILKTKKKNITHNLTLTSDTTFYHPESYNDLKKILAYLKKNKEKVLIRGGDCGYGDKSNLQNSEYAISLSKLKKIISKNCDCAGRLEYIRIIFLFEKKKLYHF